MCLDQRLRLTSIPWAETSGSSLTLGIELALRNSRKLKHLLAWSDLGEDHEAEISKDYHQLTGIPCSLHDGGALDDLSDDYLGTLRYVNQLFGR